MEVMNSVDGVVRVVISFAVIIVIMLSVKRASVEISGAKSCQTFSILVSLNVDRICVHTILLVSLYFVLSAVKDVDFGILESCAFSAGVVKVLHHGC